MDSSESMKRTTDPVVIVTYDLVWPVRFHELAAAIRRELDDVALRIDHIGSTAVPGLAAKPIIDIQVSVAALEPVDPFRAPLERIGYVRRADSSDRTKRYFRERPGAPRTHILVRKHGSWSEQFALLCRDYLRCHPAVAAEYAEVKRRLATQFRDDRPAYTEAKNPFIWSVMAAASDWSQEIGWDPPLPDA